ncbi:2-succinyl-5-enolpyruvyl-6-hydroxy-3-cyclohexene-1-carboxylic-acid synthase [Thermomicrobiaceae bacterium CFH 74404]|uniref:2-succinyl-5-enolpyruvyl-6-hydroxy-3-cyclohexene-1-carboxylate synthase n=1 Tax=Thermalbibacter longus TaxID=2951981 RepID=A0AA41WFZ8_9BACT|nr:2-succinyl-5-enolpyruvyl-6-hydroxy-3-cyclohexene-1-carboxylic-acid synthase [Thermalbibacter longus]MCM8749360.1 2-succinyl-5-enolpyruvyl-6-hydroxy-3-cyclohexene-1-carboxylic-acid synthase [Thermalbibacter longus]
MDYQAALAAYVGAFVDELARAGVRHACFAPGSRSTPLVLALAREPRIRLWDHLDERSTAFFALGLAKALREPVAVVCTSGTAAANFLPAVVEAHYSRVPLLVLTADRPPELRDMGAPQAIDQLRLYGSYAKWFVEVALPEGTPLLLRYARALAARAAATAREEPAGPVHLNFPFREPLIPLAAEPPDVSGPEALAWLGRPDGEPFARVLAGPRQPSAALVRDLAELLAGLPRGVIVAGPQPDEALAPALARLAATLGYPILADPLSQVRCGPHDRDLVVDAYDAFLRDPEIAGALSPQAVLRFGAIPTSKPLLLYLERHAGAQQIVVDPAGWPDPLHLASHVVHADPAALAEALATQLAGIDCRPDPGWSELWRSIDMRARATIREEVERIQEPFEGRVFAELAALLPDGATLFAGNSMPVRDLDTFFPGSGHRLRFLANRGANGIDGVVSTALGAAAALPAPLILVIGDLSFYHDMNGLLAARRHGLRATIVLLNNDGGGIFSFLPQAEHGEQFERLFGTPHGLDFRHAAALYGLAFTRVESWPAFREAVRASLAGDSVSVIEVPTERARNVELHRRIWPAVAQAVRGAVLPAMRR